MDGADGNFIDQAMLDYVAAARAIQECVRQALTQVSGFGLILMTGSRSAKRAEEAVIAARSMARQALCDAAALCPPARAAHHHHHLCKAAEATCWAFAAAGNCAAPDAADSDRDRLSRALHAASQHLRWTAQLLPGFEMVDFGQACCAVHAPAFTMAAG